MSFVQEDGYTLEDALRAVGPGWADILRTFWPSIPPSRIIVQVKEKFGGLRLYHDPVIGEDGEYPPEDKRASVAFEVAVETAESSSYETCEQCGARGCIAERHGWWKTMCESCRAKP